MNFTNRISQTLHDEHGATVALMERLEQLLARGRRAGPPDTADGSVARLLSDLSTGLENDVDRHFIFEEDHVFNYLGGRRRYRYLRASDKRASNHASACREGRRIGAHSLEQRFYARKLGGVYVAWARNSGDLMLAHVQKEEMALLPVLEENMDSETEARLYQEYVENV